MRNIKIRETEIPDEFIGRCAIKNIIFKIWNHICWCTGLTFGSVFKDEYY